VKIEKKVSVNPFGKADEKKEITKSKWIPTMPHNNKFIKVELVKDKEE